MTHLTRDDIDARWTAPSGAVYFPVFFRTLCGRDVTEADPLPTATTGPFLPADTCRTCWEVLRKASGGPAPK